MPRGLLSAAVFFAAVIGLAEDTARTGPQTEKRFPPLKVPPGFKATLFACDPLIEYPSVIAAGPDSKSLFVAIDYVTGLGEDIVRRDEIRLIEDADGDGYADKATVYAKGFNSIQGLAYHDGSLFVMHAPFLTVLKKGGTERTDLLTGLGLTPEVNLTRLHCANGVTVGHDGWLYLAVGDHGVDVKRPEGDRLVLHGGGILRCRPDGRDLHVFASGLRNIYDVALDAELNVFVRDNENDGGRYKIRVCHSFFGADHGYPYLYTDHPDEALPPIADLNLGSSAGGVCYLERALPPEYRGNLFFCEWGRSVVRYVPKPAGSGFGPVREFEFAVAAENDPYGFKPTDIVVQRDGALMVSDWADGQRPKRGRGRIYRITAPGGPDDSGSPTGLDSPSYSQRIDAQLALQKRGLKGFDSTGLGPIGRMHAVWLLASSGNPGTVDDLLAIAKSDADARVRIQAVRAVADRLDPVLVHHRLADAGRGSPEMVPKLAQLADGADAALQREVIVALGRLKWHDAPDWLADRVAKPDAALAHAAQQALRGSENWPAVLKLLDRPNGEAIRAIAMRAAAQQYDPALVDGLIERLKSERDPVRCKDYAELLTRVHRKPGEYVYWGYRPLPRPANTVDWDRSAAIAAALDGFLADFEHPARLSILKRMHQEKIAIAPATLVRRLEKERDGEAVRLLLDSLAGRPVPNDLGDSLNSVIRDRQHTAGNRLVALTILGDGLAADSAAVLLELAGSLEDGPLLAETLRRIGRFPKLDAVSALASRTSSKLAEVRAAAVGSLAEFPSPRSNDRAVKLLSDSDAKVRAAAAAAAGKLGVPAAAETLVALARESDAGVRAASLDALRRLKDARGVPAALAALDDRFTQLAALEYLGALGGPEHAQHLVDLARRTPPADALSAIVRILATWSRARAIAEIHGAGNLIHWSVSEPLAPAEADRLLKAGELPKGKPFFAAGPDWRVDAGPPPDAVRLAFADVVVAENAAVEFSYGGGPVEVRLNGTSIHTSKGPARFAGELSKGENRVVVRVSSPEFQLSFRRKNAIAAVEKLAQAALVRTGDVERGKRIFFNAEKSLCIKCHRLGDQGEKVGPELTGIGSRFGRVYLIESILEPSRTVVAGFAAVRIELTDGRVLTGVKAAETDTTFTLVDSEAKKQVLRKDYIASQKPLTLSTMPDGFEKRVTEQEFVDLIAFLVSQKDRTPPPPGKAP